MLEEVYAFISKKAMAPMAFGRLAANRPRLVADMRAGRTIKPALQARLRRFIEENS